MAKGAEADGDGVVIIGGVISGRLMVAGDLTEKARL